MIQQIKNLPSEQDQMNSQQQAKITKQIQALIQQPFSMVRDIILNFADTFALFTQINLKYIKYKFDKQPFKAIVKATAADQADSLVQASQSFLNICKQYYTAVRNKSLFKLIYDIQNEQLENEKVLKVIKTFLKNKSIKVHNNAYIYIFTYSAQTSSQTQQATQSPSLHRKQSFEDTAVEKIGQEESKEKYMYHNVEKKLKCIFQELIENLEDDHSYDMIYSEGMDQKDSKNMIPVQVKDDSSSQDLKLAGAPKFQPISFARPQSINMSDEFNNKSSVLNLRVLEKQDILSLNYVKGVLSSCVEIYEKFDKNQVEERYFKKTPGKIMYLMQVIFNMPIISTNLYVSALGVEDDIDQKISLESQKIEELNQKFNAKIFHFHLDITLDLFKNYLLRAPKFKINIPMMLAHVYNSHCEEPYFKDSDYLLLSRVYRLKLNKIFYEKIDLKDIRIFLQKHYRQFNFSYYENFLKCYAFKELNKQIIDQLQQPDKPQVQLFVLVQFLNDEEDFKVLPKIPVIEPKIEKQLQVSPPRAHTVLPQTRLKEK